MKIYSLQKSILIKKNDDFDKIFHKGTIHRSTFFNIFWVEKIDLRVGFTVGKGFKNKVQRNRLKRRTRELWRTLYRQFNLVGDFVIVTKVSALNATYSELKYDFINILKRIKNE